jgi:hypothetical protein
MIDGWVLLVSTLFVVSESTMAMSLVLSLASLHHSMSSRTCSAPRLLLLRLLLLLLCFVSDMLLRAANPRTVLPYKIASTFTFSTTSVDFALQENDLLNGRTFLLFNSPLFPQGEMRGQLERRHRLFAVCLTNPWLENLTCYRHRIIIGSIVLAGADCLPHCRSFLRAVFLASPVQAPSQASSWPTTP